MNFRKKLRVCFLVFFLLLSPGVVHVSAQLTVSSHTPGQNQLNCDTNTHVTVTFSDAIPDTAVHTNNFYINGTVHGKIPGDFSGGDTQTITFVPNIKFSPGETVTVTLTKGINDINNNPLQEEYSFHFIVESGSADTYFIEHIISDTAAGGQHVHASDVDGDGDMDVLSAAYSSRKYSWYENTGNQIFIEHIIHNNAGGANGIYAADMNHDGNMDILTSSAYDPDFVNGNTIAWYENDGNSNFTERIISSSAYNAVRVIASDVNGDGHMDALSSMNYTEWYMNDGNQNFTTTQFTPPDYPEGYYSNESVHSLDMDKDGDIDIISVYGSDSLIIWYENDGSENFTEQILTNDQYGVKSIYPIDMDGDSDIDILVSNDYTNQISWYENDGSQNFTQNIIYTGYTPHKIHAADLNGDGNMDIIASFYSGANRIFWFENDGNQNFTQKTVASYISTPQNVYTADMDNDGDLDVLSISYNQGQVIWYENASLPAPAIDVQPSGKEICEGSSTAFSIEASGEGTINYQWEVNTGSGFSEIQNNEYYSGATTNSLGISSVPYSMNGYTYRCSATNEGGTNYSDQASLAVKSNTTITMQPETSINVCENASNITIKISAEGSSLSYQWYKGLNAITGETDTSLTIIPDISNSGNYHCYVSGDCDGVSSDISNVVIDTNTTILAQPELTVQACENGTDINLSISAEGSNLSYQWFKDGTSITQATDPSLLLTPDFENAGTYYCEVTGNCGMVASDNASVSVDSATVITSHPGSQENIDESSEVTFSVQADGKNLSYQWRKDETNLTDDDHISGSQTNQLTLSNVSKSDEGVYDCFVSGLCGELVSNDAILSLVPTIIELSETEIEIYPNPSNGEFIIRNAEGYNISITDVTGKLIYENNLPGQTSSINLQNNYEQGIYLIRLIKQECVIVSKILLK